MNATYRCRRGLVWLGLMGIAVGAVLAAVGSGGSPPDTRAIVLTLLIASGSLWIGSARLLRAWRHRLVVTEVEVEYVGILSTRRIALEDVLEARWVRGGTAGVLSLKTSSDTINLSLGIYVQPVRRELIRFFRLRLAEPIQHNWEKYWRYHWRQLDEPDPAKAEVFAEQTWALRRRLHLWCLLGALIVVPVAVVVWQYTGDATPLRRVTLLLLLWPLVFFARAERGRVAEQCSLRPRVRPPVMAGEIILLLTWIVALPLAAFMTPSARIVFHGGLACHTLLILVGTIGPLIQIERFRSEGAKLAEQEYMRPIVKDKR
jgi:hypothetical protein